MKDLILIGGGGHCRSCIDVIENERKFKIKGILDNNLKYGTSMMGYPIIGNDDDIENLSRGGGCIFLLQ